MRKFNLKDKVLRRMMGLDIQPSEKPENRKQEISDSGNAIPDEGNHQLRIAWRTDVGRVRRNNQDAVILGGGLYGVADGMGGHQGGEIASTGLRDGLLREISGKEPDEEELRGAIERVNLELWNRQEKDAALSGMGTTLTVLWPSESHMIIAQVGDSRAYLLRDGQFRQMTSDHSMVADMVRRGMLTEEQAACHPMRNYITRAVGTEEAIEPDLMSVLRQPGDRWLICSDGLYSQMNREELQSLMSAESLEDAANRLMDTAMEYGGKDNITLILLQDLLRTAPPSDDSRETREQEDTGERDKEASEDFVSEDTAAGTESDITSRTEAEHIG